MNPLIRMLASLFARVGLLKMYRRGMVTRRRVPRYSVIMESSSGEAQGSSHTSAEILEPRSRCFVDSSNIQKCDMSLNKNLHHSVF